MSWTINFIMMHVSVLDPLLLACASKQNRILINFSVCKLNIDTKNQERLEACSSLMFTKKEREKKTSGKDCTEISTYVVKQQMCCRGANNFSTLCIIYTALSLWLHRFAKLDKSSNLSPQSQHVCKGGCYTRQKIENSN